MKGAVGVAGASPPAQQPFLLDVHPKEKNDFSGKKDAIQLPEKKPENTSLSQKGLVQSFPTAQKPAENQKKEAEKLPAPLPSTANSTVDLSRTQR